MRALQTMRALPKQVQNPQTQLLCSSSVKQSGWARNANENNYTHTKNNTKTHSRGRGRGPGSAGPRPLLMPMDASSASDKKRKVIEGESSPRGLKRMRFG